MQADKETTDEVRVEPLTNHDYAITETSLITEFSANSLYNTPTKSPTGKLSWLTPDPQHTGESNGTTFTLSAELSRPHVSKELRLSKAAIDSVDDELLCPIELVPRVLCVGATCMDVLIRVEKFPEENQKTRSKDSVLCGGGNASNTAVCLSRLGFPVCLVSKRGNDLFGQQIIRELHLDHVDTTFVTTSNSTSSAVSHIIVNEENTSRTIVHSPLNEEIRPDELSKHKEKMTSMEQYGWVHFDSRHTEAALDLAKASKAAGCYISIDVEKDRPPYLKELLSLCDVVFMSKDFPGAVLKNCHGKLYQMMLVIKEELCPKARLIVATDGENGSFVLKKPEDSLADLKSRNVHNIVSEETVGKYVYKTKESRDLGIENTYSKLPLKVQKTVITRVGKDEVEMFRCSAMSLRNGIVDSTGAGDAYIGGFLAGLLNNFEIKTCMILGTLVATKKLGSIGARNGLLTSQEVRAILDKLT